MNREIHRAPGSFGIRAAAFFFVVFCLFLQGFGHDLSDPDQTHQPHYDRSVRPPLEVVDFSRVHDFADVDLLSGPVVFDGFLLSGKTSANIAFDNQNALAVSIAEIFRPFAPKVSVRWDDKFFYVESDGFPNHRMMVGIRAWQQQVPIPQKYTGANAWRFPLKPVVAKYPLSAKDHFFRGAIAIAANGVPIFNPIKNDGRTDTFLAGELDEFGGHAGRADDYHYHIAPLHLQELVGKGKPVAYALDGYPIYGLTEPDGSPVGKLDAFDGHVDEKGNYHYHASLAYPYVNGGFHGEVVEEDGQVSPQPRADGVRPSTEPLRGARITGFVLNKDGSVDLTYTVDGETRRINYAVQKDGGYRFEFIDGKGKSTVENYSRSDRRRDENRPPRESNGEKRIPWIVQHASEMDTNGDGALTRAELNAEADKTFAAYDKNRNGRLEADEVQTGEVRSAMGGFVRQHAKELDANSDSSITKEELLAVVTRMFDKADRDGDGKLSKEETKDAQPLDRPRKN
ncbi:MAG: YHYH protein [Acidobacteria bacterium]|nr:YHYH protein [Acidobacteriota bacterium]